MTPPPSTRTVDPVAQVGVIRKRTALASISLGRKSVCFWQRQAFEFAFGLQPIIELIAWEAATFKIDFIGPQPDFFVTGFVVYGRILWVRLNRAYAILQNLISLVFQFHTLSPSLSSLYCLHLTSPAAGRPCHESP